MKADIQQVGEKIEKCQLRMLLDKLTVALTFRNFILHITYALHITCYTDNAFYLSYMSQFILHVTCIFHNTYSTHILCYIFHAHFISHITYTFRVTCKLLPGKLPPHTRNQNRLQPGRNFQKSALSTQLLHLIGD